MPLRALLVLLVMLNFGVATWWLLRPAPPAPAPWVQPADVPRLQLLGEAVAADEAAGPGAGADAAAVDAPAADGEAVEPAPEDAAGAADGGVAASPGSPVADAPAVPAAPTAATAQPAAGTATATAAPAAMRCTSFGPFADAASVAAARGALQPLGASRVRVRDVVQAPRGWRVVMPPQADRAAADALAAQIRDAGFDDLLVVPSGDEANAIALGRYGSEATARRREAALRTAGFPAQAQPLGDVMVAHWLDVAAGPAFDVAAARAASAAAEARDIDCSGVTGSGAPTR